LLGRLQLHKLDVVLSNRKVHASAGQAWRCRRIAKQPVSLVGNPLGRGKRFSFPQDLARFAVLLPGPDSDIRSGFDALCDDLGIRCQVMAEVDDMAMLRLLARDSGAIALLPRVVVRDELRSRRLAEYCVVPQLFENFYAVTVQRHFAHPLLKTLLAQPEAAVLDAQAH
jgi:LysR family transcriptional regulator, transcriptional activator of nhaA